MAKTTIISGIPIKNADITQLLADGASGISISVNRYEENNQIQYEAVAIPIYDDNRLATTSIIVCPKPCFSVHI